MSSTLVIGGLGSSLLVIDGLGGESVAPSLEPNPAETVWTLGVGGAIVSPSVVSGAGILLATTLYNNGSIVGFTSADVLDSSVWGSGNAPVSIVPVVDWISAPGGTLTLFISPGQSAFIAPGIYRMQVGVTPAGASRLIAYDGILEVLATVGAIAAPIVWCDDSDVLLYATSPLSLQAVKAANDATGFLTQRANATSKLLRRIIKGYNPRFGFVRTRMNTPDPITQELDVVVPGSVYPSKADLTTALNTPGGIVLEEQLREIIARHAISLILRRQATGGSGDKYAAEAAAQESMAEEQYHCYQAQMVSASPIGGNTRFLIDMDCIILPAGTAP